MFNGNIFSDLLFIDVVLWAGRTDLNLSTVTVHSTPVVASGACFVTVIGGGCGGDSALRDNFQRKR